MDFNTGLNNLIGQTKGAKTPTEAGELLVTGLGELVKQTARGGNPAVDCEDLGAAVQAKAGEIGQAIGQVAEQRQSASAGSQRG